MLLIMTGTADTEALEDEPLTGVVATNSISDESTTVSIAAPELSVVWRVNPVIGVSEGGARTP